MISMYQASIPPCLHALTALAGVLAKGEAHCTARSIDPSILLQSRLYPDMFPLTRQVQIASDSANRLGARLAGVAAPSMPDTETSFPDLQRRLTATMDFLKTLKPEQFEGGDTREVVIPNPKGDVRLSGLDYLQGVAFPNLYFHSATTYGLLRHAGVEVGKMDFLGAKP